MDEYMENKINEIEKESGIGLSKPTRENIGRVLTQVFHDGITDGEKTQYNLTQEETDKILKKLSDYGFQVTQPSQDRREYGVETISEEYFNEKVNEVFEDLQEKPKRKVFTDECEEELKKAGITYTISNGGTIHFNKAHNIPLEFKVTIGLV